MDPIQFAELLNLLQADTALQPIESAPDPKAAAQQRAVHALWQVVQQMMDEQEQQAQNLLKAQHVVQQMMDEQAQQATNLHKAQQAKRKARRLRKEADRKRKQRADGGEVVKKTNLKNAERMLVSRRAKAKDNLQRLLDDESEKIRAAKKKSVKTTADHDRYAARKARLAKTPEGRKILDSERENNTKARAAKRKTDASRKCELMPQCSMSPY
jgi:hypothetical protein